MPRRIAMIAVAALVLAVVSGCDGVTPDGAERQEGQGQQAQARAGGYTGPRGGAR